MELYALALKSVNLDFDVEEILGYELAPHPTPCLTKMGLLERVTKVPTDDNIDVEIPARWSTNDANAIFLDGCAILWVVSWPDKGTVAGYLNNFRRYLLEEQNT